MGNSSYKDFGVPSGFLKIDKISPLADSESISDYNEIIHKIGEEIKGYESQNNYKNEKESVKVETFEPIMSYEELENEFIKNGSNGYKEENLADEHKHRENVQEMHTESKNGRSEPIIVQPVKAETKKAIKNGNTSSKKKQAAKKK